MSRSTWTTVMWRVCHFTRFWVFLLKKVVVYVEDVCVCERDSVFVFWMSRACTAKQKPLHGSLFVIAAEEADVLDLPSPFPSQSVFRIRLIERSLPLQRRQSFSCDSNFGSWAGHAASLNELLHFWRRDLNSWTDCSCFCHCLSLIRNECSLLCSEVSRGLLTKAFYLS